MNECNKVDIDGCNYTMDVLTPYFNTDVKWCHTSIEKGGYCKYDMDWFLSDGRRASVENKDRRYKWENGKKTDIQQFFSTYGTIMYNIEKVEFQLPLYLNEGIVPIYTAGYADGVAVFDISLFPDDWRERWKDIFYIAKKTVGGGVIKVPQERILLPKSYCTFFPKDRNKPIERPTYEQ